MRQLEYNQAFMLILITLVTSTFGSGDANARLRTTENTKYFDVSGATPAELRSSLRRAYPDFDARTNFHFQSRYTWKATGKKCRMTSVTVDLTLEIILPRIKAGNELAPEVQKEWDLFIAGVVSHENEHVRLYKAGAADLEKRLRSFSSSCKSMQRDASAIEKAGAERMQKMNDDYDAETDGGRKDQDNAID